MFKDITLGQYFPADSIIHKLDPRMKLLLLFVLIIGVFFAITPIQYAIFILFTLVLVFLTKIPLKLYLKSFKPIFWLAVFTGSLNLFLTRGGTVLFNYNDIIVITELGVNMAVTMLLRLFLLITISSTLTYTTSPIALSGSMEAMLSPLKKIKFPAHEVAMMMSIALRFIPTLIDEVDIIVKAQTARGANFNTGSLIKRIKALIPLLLPLFISAFRRAEDLATAMEARCYNGGEGRTSYKIMKYESTDFVALAICALVVVAVVII